MKDTYGKIILAGGGGAADSRPLDELLAALIGLQGKLLYLPMAMRGLYPFEICLEWIEDTFLPLGIEQIEMWENLAEHQAGELDGFDAVYIGGGNTYSLLSEFRLSRFDSALTSYVRRGGTVYGGSAGAAILGADIQTIAHMDKNSVGLTSTRGLNLIDGRAIWVHYLPHEDADIADYVREREQPVIAIAERSGMVWDGAKLRAIGFEPAYEFTRQGKRPI